MSVTQDGPSPARPADRLSQFPERAQHVLHAGDQALLRKDDISRETENAPAPLSQAVSGGGYARAPVGRAVRPRSAFGPTRSHRG
jgi:hypothetical protein